MLAERVVEERRGLWLSAGAGLGVGVLGLVFAAASDSEAIMLDGVFNLTYFVTALFTLKVASLVLRGETLEYPLGYGFFEPLVNGVKGLLILGVAALALFGAIEAILEGGSKIRPGLATVYGVIASVLCWATALMLKKLGRLSGSPLVQVDAKSWTINALISTAVLGAFVAILVMEGTPLEPAAPYMDPALVIVVVIISVGAPVRFGWQSLMELLNRTPSLKLVELIREEIREALSDLPVRRISVRVVQPGRRRLVLAHVVLPDDFESGSITRLDHARHLAAQALQRDYGETVLDVVFTADPDYGAFEDEAPPGTS